MKEATKAKWRRRWNSVKRKAKNVGEYIVPAVAGVGCVLAMSEAKHIQRLYKLDAGLAAGMIKNRERIQVLERQHGLLMEKCLAETKGKGEIQ